MKIRPQLTQEVNRRERRKKTPKKPRHQIKQKRKRTPKNSTANWCTNTDTRDKENKPKRKPLRYRRI